MSKPRFRRCEYFRYKRLKQSWRKPRGKHNKMRNYLGGKPLSPAIGYGTKAEIRGLHPSGMHEVLVENISQLGEVDAKTQAVRIAATVGKRKRSGILAQAKKLKLTVLNPGVEKAVKKKPKREAAAKAEPVETAEKIETGKEEKVEKKPAEKPKKKKAPKK